MSRLLTGGLLLAALLTTTALPSQATCAWMLWTRMENSSDGKSPTYRVFWKFEKALPSSEECAKNIVDNLEYLQRLYTREFHWTVQIVSNSTSGLLHAGKNGTIDRVIDLLCLPDSIKDPNDYNYESLLRKHGPR